MFNPIVRKKRTTKGGSLLRHFFSNNNSSHWVNGFPLLWLIVVSLKLLRPVLFGHLEIFTSISQCANPLWTTVFSTAKHLSKEVSSRHVVSQYRLQIAVSKSLLYLLQVRLTKIMPFLQAQREHPFKVILACNSSDKIYLNYLGCCIFLLWKNKTQKTQIIDSNNFGGGVVKISYPTCSSVFLFKKKALKGVHILGKLRPFSGFATDPQIHAANFRIIMP